jgi:hypothetical protein
MEHPIFYIHVEPYCWDTGVYISVFNKVLLQLKLHWVAVKIGIKFEPRLFRFYFDRI